MQGKPQTNVSESVDGVERFVTAYDCSGQMKGMAYLADQIQVHIDSNVNLVIADGACGGMLKIIEQGNPW